MSTNDRPERDDAEFVDPQPRIEDAGAHRTAEPPEAERTEDGAAPQGDAEADGGRRGRRRKAARGGFGQWLKELPIMLAIAFVIAVLLKSFVVQAFWIPSGSMEQTLHGCPGCTGDRILVNRMSYWFSDPEPGDIVVFEAPSSWEPEVHVTEPDDVLGQSWLWLKRLVGAAPPAAKDLVKRVIATEGQTVSCCDAQGRVLVDGKPLDEPYIYLDGQPPNAAYALRDFGPIKVPKDRLFVMGDHRNGSADSRAHIDDQYQGTVPVDSVVGRAFVILYPFDRFRWLGEDNPQAQALPHAGPAGLLAEPPVLALLFVAPMSGVQALRRRRREDEPCTP
ncbi:signal peptidase I [Cumulibacter manganitolerans]|uniref:signal peptidase I n=1 Tax=Cumulibacter manganitolerans TaxID=1884992 RepID=UPI001E361618|nr:signal peptidase I [Cumulibacter manganitolerans]